MKLAERVKQILYKRTVNNLFQRNSEEDIKEAVLFLRLWNDNSKVIPYSLFEEGCLINYKDILETPQGLVFKHWLIFNTISIEKPFNKSRKITRKLKDLEGKLLTMDVPVHFVSALTCLFGAFFIDLKEKGVTVTFSFSDEPQMQRVLEDIAICLSILLYIDSVCDTDKLEQLLDYYVNASDDELYMFILQYIADLEFPLLLGV